MRAEGHSARGLFRSETGSEREAATNPLGRCENIGLDAILFMRIKRSGARHTALHFVEHKHQIVLVRQRAQSLEKFIGCWPNTALALDRFD